MDDFEEIVQIKSEDFVNIPNFKDNIAEISFMKEIHYFHTNIFYFKIGDKSLEPSALHNSFLKMIQHKFYEVSVITQKLG